MCCVVTEPRGGGDGDVPGDAHVGRGHRGRRGQGRRSLNHGFHDMVALFTVKSFYFFRH